MYSDVAYSLHAFKFNPILHVRIKNPYVKRKFETVELLCET
jgi:hypothetical protein